MTVANSVTITFDSSTLIDRRGSSSSQGQGDALLLTRLNLNAGVPQGAGPGSWGIFAQAGASLELLNDSGVKYLRASYPADASEDNSGANYFYGGYTPLEMHQEIYITVYARMLGPARFGCKFCKLFGGVKDEGENLANTTFTLEYGSGEMNYTAYGDGGVDPVTEEIRFANDSQCGMAFYVPNYQDTGRVGSLPQTFEHGGVFTAEDWGTGWHKFQFRHRYNSGDTEENEINDGATETYIDGELHSRALNIFNRHFSNLFLETINFFGWSQGQGAFEIDMRDITVSLNGWVD